MVEYKFNSGWEQFMKDNEVSAVKKTFEFKDFVGAFGFMTKVAIHSEKMNIRMSFIHKFEDHSKTFKNI